MATLVTKINCPSPEHQDSTPSCGVYDDGSAYCFGCSTYFAKVEGFSPSKQVREVENIEERIKYIENLPTVTFRGLEFPHDDRGYYILWPDRNYYKLRLWTSSDSDLRYVSPIGHSAPMFLLKQKERARTITLVEGEINALSLSLAYPTSTIVGLPGANTFFDRAMNARSDYFRHYSKIVVFVDEDPAGFTGAMRFKDLVKPLVPDISIGMLSTDFNDLLMKGGINAIQKQVENLGLSREVQE